MNPRKINTTLKVGFFVLMGIVFLFAYVLLLGQNRTYFSSTLKYKIQFQKVDGLFAGAVVTVNGVPAGNVSNIHFIHETGAVKVSVSVVKEFAEVITHQSSAMLATKGLLGDKYIAITTKGRADSKQLPEGSYIPTSPVGGMLGLLGSKKTGDKLSHIMDELLILVQTLNQDKTLNKAGSLAQNLSHMLSPSKSQQVSQILTRLNNLLTKLDEGEGTAGALINNKNVYHRVLGLLGQSPYHKYLPSLVEEQNSSPSPPAEKKNNHL